MSLNSQVSGSRLVTLDNRKVGTRDRLHNDFCWKIIFGIGGLKNNKSIDSLRKESSYSVGVGVSMLGNGHYSSGSQTGPWNSSS